MVLVVTLLIAGGVLLFAEAVLPGLIAGALGVTCLVAGVAMSYRNFGPSVGRWVLCATLAGLVVEFFIWLKWFPHSRLSHRLTSHGATGELGAERPELLGQAGVAHTALRPAGVALLGDRRVDVVTEGALIERGTVVKVVAVEGARVVVRAV